MAHLPYLYACNGVFLCFAGIKEADVVAEMSALTPCSTKRLLDILLRQEVLLVQKASQAPLGPGAFFTAASSSQRPTQVLHMLWLIVWGHGVGI